ncbi:hypothetical protein TNCV_2477181 [Trichonephila clavipes]|nr:hypothetical protein TNCV_2477181 [Trichonephila clavipes]
MWQEKRPKTADLGQETLLRPAYSPVIAPSDYHFFRQINLEVDSDDVQKLLDAYNQELTMDELIEMHEQEQGIEELQSLDPVQSEDRMRLGIGQKASV